MVSWKYKWGYNKSPKLPHFSCSGLQLPHIMRSTRQTANKVKESNKSGAEETIFFWTVTRIVRERKDPQRMPSNCAGVKSMFYSVESLKARGCGNNKTLILKPKYTAQIFSIHGLVLDTSDFFFLWLVIFPSPRGNSRFNINVSEPSRYLSFGTIDNIHLTVLQTVWKWLHRRQQGQGNTFRAEYGGRFFPQ